MDNSTLNTDLDVDQTTKTIIDDYQACVLHANEIIDVWRPIVQEIIGHGALTVRNQQENNDASVLTSAFAWYLSAYHQIKVDKELVSYLRTLAMVIYCTGRWGNPEQARKEQIP